MRAGGAMACARSSLARGGWKSVGEHAVALLCVRHVRIICFVEDSCVDGVEDVEIGCG